MFRKAVLALAAPLLVLASCADEADQAAVEVKTGAAAVSALRATPDAAAEAGTARVEMVMEMALLGESFEMTATGAYDAAAERMAMSMDLGAMFDQLAASTGETIPVDLDGPMEVVADGSTFYLRAPMFEALGAEGWLSMSPEDLGTSAEGLGLGAGAYDPSKMLENLRGVVGEPEVVGEEEVRGVATTHYRAELDLEKALAEVPADQRALLEAQLEQVRAAGDATIPVDVWIDEDDLPRRMRMDMAGMLGALTGDDATATVTIEMFDFGEPVDIAVPAPDEVTPFTEVMGAIGEGFGP
jgi:LppX_LprAFG lipoprotein